MQFPPRINNPRLKPEERASMRLRYMIERALLDKHLKISILGLAQTIGYDHSSIQAAFKRGAMTYEMAQAIEDHIGRRTLPFEYLMNPLMVPQEKQ